MPQARDFIDAQVGELCRAARFEEAAAVTLERFGGEIMHFLANRVDDPQLASDAFSLFSEDLCRGLPQFRFNASLRTWIYTRLRTRNRRMLKRSAG